MYLLHTYMYTNCRIQSFICMYAYKEIHTYTHTLAHTEQHKHAHRNKTVFRIYVVVFHVSNQSYIYLCIYINIYIYIYGYIYTIIVCTAYRNCSKRNFRKVTCRHTHTHTYTNKPIHCIYNTIYIHT